MANYEVKDIRNIALIGHGSSGKTSLGDAMLFAAKATKRLGSVDEGTSTFDYEADEIDKKISIDSSIAFCNWQGKEINIIDTPGYPDFVSQVISSLAAVDIALVEISAVDGIQINTRKVWQLAKDNGNCTAIVVTKMDGDNINVEELLESIHETFGKECVPLNLPKGSGSDFKGVAKVLHLETSDDVIGDITKINEQVIEAVVAVDDDLMEKYLEGETIDDEKLHVCFRQSMKEASLTPIFFCSSRKGEGVKEILNTIAEFFPSPETFEKTGFKDIDSGEEIKIDPSLDSAFSAQVFKSVIDPFVGKLSYFRVFSGKIDEGEQHLCNSRTEKREKVSHFYKMFGKEQKLIETAMAGDILAVPKLEDVEISDTLCIDKTHGKFDEIKFPTPMVSLALMPKGKGIEHKVSAALTKLASEDKAFVVSHDLETNDLVVTGASSLHLKIMIERMKNRFDIEVDTKPPKIPYKETITGKAEAKYKHKKQSGGHGQYGDVQIRIEPLERGAGFVFKNSIVGGSIPSQYIPAVEKGMKEVLNKGFLCGHPMVDFQVDLFYGSFHAVDSSEAAFKIAGVKALQEAFTNANPVLLEPVVNIEVVIPGEFMGEISGNLSGRRGRIQGMDAIGDMQVVKASVPMAEITNYESELKSITGGQGSYTMEFSHYDVVLQHIADAIIKSEKQEAEHHEK